MTLVIDNYDSFTYNLVQYLGEIAGEEPRVARNDAITLLEIARMGPDRLVISPGPKDPRDVGLSNEIIARFSAIIPTLGVCLWPSMYRLR
ncbi:MAG TPA: hypothetical protein VLH40_01320 [Atribacteraceae bacterium]|nr:hypothetical protein [Atribacteraceae bacterium]